ncbi:Sortilin- receptor [Desmophyllum pertusum]|uniref:Sortilin- receptor n=1 Tax=Desmophyllum pertusum TaxID=174260 RepID=A0A9W9Z1W8_9CNID|nr:Sortilin- receptor [Desmophyllum pertusum]
MAAFWVDNNSLRLENWTVQCYTGRDYKRFSQSRNCPCSRDDFQCDYGFQRKNFDEECTPIDNEDLDNEIIPDNCPEGVSYNRTQGSDHLNLLFFLNVPGFRKITGDTCVNGTEKDFLPVLTSCPVKELFNLTLSSSNVTEDGIVAVETGGAISFTATVQKGFQPNIMYR